jgi:beta-xylosidase
MVCEDPATGAETDSSASRDEEAVVVNFDAACRQVTRLDTSGRRIDAHDGEIRQFGGRYYLYGTSYGCGFRWRTAGTPFCGMKSYSSRDLVHWTDHGPLFDATTPAWQRRCDGSTYGCFRPHVLFNRATSQYVLWINAYDGVVGYHVLQSTTPSGPFVELPLPTLGVNQGAPTGGVNNGDENLFVDDDGTGYIAYTDWRTNGDIVVEELDPEYSSGTGRFVRLGLSRTEAPALFRGEQVYYLVYSDPNCAYCGGTGATYMTASQALGPWQPGRRISGNSCGGQPSNVATIRSGNDLVYLFQSDLWRDSEANQARANYYWGPLSFAANGSIADLKCLRAFTPGS